MWPAARPPTSQTLPVNCSYNHKPGWILTSIILSEFILLFSAPFVDHFDHIKKVGGAEIIGFGGDYDGVTRWVQSFSRLIGAWVEQWALGGEMSLPDCPRVWRMCPRCPIWWPSCCGENGRMMKSEPLWEKISSASWGMLRRWGNHTRRLSPVCLWYDSEHKYPRAAVCLLAARPSWLCPQRGTALSFTFMPHSSNWAGCCTAPTVCGLSGV